METDTGIIGAAVVPHAPQMLSLPPTEDAEQVARVRAAMAEIGDKFRALKPDLLIVVSNDHGDDFALHAVPPFVIHCGNGALGEGDHAGLWNVDGGAGYALVTNLQEEGFDPAFTLTAPVGTFFTIPVEFMGYPRDTYWLPLFVNSYVPPQPSPERCFAFGQALDRALKRMGRRAVLVASGGLSHYPATARYADPGPDDATDEEIFKKASEGNLRFVLSYDATALDRSGNVEVRPILIVAGAIGDRQPEVALYEPNWHHNYAVLGWTGTSTKADETLYYGPTASDRGELSRAVHALRVSDDACASFLRDPNGFADGYRLGPGEREALHRLKEVELRDDFGIHPLLVFGAMRAVDAQRDESSASSDPS